MKNRLKITHSNMYIKEVQRISEIDFLSVARTGIREVNTIGQLTIHALTENIDSVLVSYKELGLMKISALLFIEAFFPLIPICGLVILNAAAYGFTEGLLLSYIGSLAGNWALYAIFYYFGHFSFFTKLKQKEKINKYAG